MSAPVMRHLLLLAASALATPAAAAVPDPARLWVEDATRDYYNGPLRLAWERPLGDWIDADGVRHGARSFAAARLVREGPHDIDVTELVRRHGADFRVVGRLADVASRESGAQGPLLIVQRAAGTLAYPASADVGMDASTHESTGADPLLKLAGGLFLRFDLPADPAVERAVLRLHVTRLWSGADVPTQIFRPDPRPTPPVMPDVPLGSEADVILRLSGSGWTRGIGWAGNASHARIDPNGSVVAWIAPGSDTALSLLYRIPAAERRPLMCLRTVMTVHRDWTARMGGKFPGLANTGQADGAADQAGWGGRRADGTRWSARTNRYGYDPSSPFADDYLALGTYVYRVNAETGHGDQIPFAAPVPKARPFTYDQCVQMNTPGRADGFAAWWVDGKPAGLMQGIIWRTHDGADTLPSEIWADVYEGGTGYDRMPHGRHTVTIHEMVLSAKRLPYAPNAAP